MMYLTQIILIFTAATILGTSGASLNQRILSGKNAEKGQFPWHARLTVYSTNGNKHFCGGSLISSKWILTSASCIVLKNSKVSNKVLVEMGGVIAAEPLATIWGEEVIPHEKFDIKNRNLEYDIALIKLKNDAPHNEDIAPILLNTDPNVSEGTTVSECGYGILFADVTDYYSPDLKYVDLKTLNSTRCASLYGLESDSHIVCTDSHQKNSCEGDRGGAISAKLPSGDSVHIGIDITGNCKEFFETAHTNTAFYREWIKKISGV